MFDKKDILEAALRIVRAKGFDAVTARSLGAELGTSSRPIFSVFENMQDVQEAIICESNSLYQSYLKEDMSKGKYPPYKASGMAYIRFAREEKELFKLLFMRKRENVDVHDVSDETEMLVDIICKQINIQRENALLFYLQMWAFVHGIATMIATEYYDWSEEECSRSLTNAYLSLKSKYENLGN